MKSFRCPILLGQGCAYLAQEGRNGKKQHIGLNEEIKWNYWDVRPIEGGGESTCQVLHCSVIAILFWD